jgi:hypothetical protein
VDLRDPVERFVSNFYYLQGVPALPEQPDALPKIRQMTLEDFARSDLEIARMNRNHQADLITARFAEAGHGAGLDGTPPRLPLDIAHGKRLLDDFEFVGLTERIQDSLLLMAYTFGWRPITEFQTFNVTPNRPRREQISPGIVERVRLLNALDAELYEHSRRLFAARLRRMADELADRCGGQGRAPLQPFLSFETLCAWAEAHYERRFAESHPTKRAFRLAFDRALPQPNWHPPETHSEHGPFRWSGPGTKSALDAPIEPGRDLRIAFRVVAAQAPDILDSLRVTANGVPVDLKRTNDTAATAVYTGTITGAAASARRPFLRLEFEVNRTVAPRAADPASQDERLLGLAFAWLEIEPAPALTRPAQLARALAQRFGAARARIGLGGQAD